MADTSTGSDRDKMKEALASLAKFAAFFSALAAVVALILRPDPTRITRIGGQTQVETAAQASHLWGAEGSPFVVVATVLRDPTNLDDARRLLEAARVAAAHSPPAPLLLTPPQRLADSTATAIEFLGATQACLLMPDPSPNLRKQLQEALGTTSHDGLWESGDEECRLPPGYKIEVTDPVPLWWSQSISGQLSIMQSRSARERVIFVAGHRAPNIADLAVAAALASKWKDKNKDEPAPIHKDESAQTNKDEPAQIFGLPEYFETENSPTSVRQVLKADGAHIRWAVVIGGDQAVSDDIKGSLQAYLDASISWQNFIPSAIEAVGAFLGLGGSLVGGLLPVGATIFVSALVGTSVWKWHGVKQLGGALLAALTRLLRSVRNTWKRLKEWVIAVMRTGVRNELQALRSGVADLAEESVKLRSELAALKDELQGLRREVAVEPHVTRGDEWTGLEDKLSQLRGEISAKALDDTRTSDYARVLLLARAWQAAARTIQSNEVDLAGAKKLTSKLESAVNGRDVTSNYYAIMAVAVLYDKVGVVSEQSLPYSML